jgi:diguanylate cyclase (GGDEF)-like protein/PAS domain S-box-containing protein
MSDREPAADIVLLASERHTSALFKRAPVGLSEIGLDGRFLRVNDELCRLLGRNADLLLTLGAADVTHPDDVANSVAALARVVETGELVSLDKRYVRLDGSIVWANSGLTRLEDDDGRPRAVLAVTVDLTERKRAAEALEESEASLAAELQAMKRLHELSSRLLAKHDLQGALEEVLDGSIAMTGAWKGDVQLVDPATQSLNLVAQRGFEPGVVEQFSTLCPWNGTACERAVKTGKRVVIEDVETDGEYQPYRALAKAAGYRAVQSTPLVSRSSGLLGVLSLHFPQPHRPSEHDLRMLDLYAHRAIDFIERIRSEQALAANEARFRALAEASPALIWQLDPDGSVVYLNPRYCELVGTPPTDFHGTAWRDMVHPDDAKAYMAAIADAQRRRALMQTRVRIGSKTDGWRWLETHASPWFDNGRYAGHVGISIDISDTVHAQEELQVSNERLKLAIEGSGDGVWDWDMRTGKMVCSGRMNEMLGLIGQDVLMRYADWEGKIHPDDSEQVLASLRACLDGVAPAYRTEYRIRCADGSWKWVMSRGIVVARDEAGRPLRMAGTLTDISEKRHSEEVIWRHANYDMLTGLPNRRLFRDRLDQEVKKSHRTGTPLALLFIDLDRFKEANDLLGHDIGDLLLIEAARRIGACVRQSDTVARLGGDEFTAILPEIDDVSHIETIAQKVIDALAAPFRLGNEVIYLSASIGVTQYPADAISAEELIRNADQAMYAAKSAGRNQFSYFTRLMRQEAHIRLRLIGDLRNALTGGEMQVYYQPVIDLANGRVVKAEALLRWHHPKLGVIEPQRFIPFAEECGLINEIGDWVFCQAAACSRDWGERLGMPFQISVNKSPVQFMSGTDERNWPHYLQTLGLNGSSISVEITEGLLLNASNSVVEKLLQYRDAGIQVAIDDFGTGYSSMAYLRKFDIDYLKIDQSFVRDVATDVSDRAIVRSMIAMAHELGLKVVAEGIETPEQKAALVEAGCDFGQGFLFSRAVPPEEFEKVLAM